jgi:hypothetical protein
LKESLSMTIAPNRPSNEVPAKRARRGRVPPRSEDDFDAPSLERVLPDRLHGEGRVEALAAARVLVGAQLGFFLNASWTCFLMSL